VKRRVCCWLLCLLGACTGTETGNPSFQGSLGYDAYSSAPNVVALPNALSANQAGGATHVDTTWLVLGDVGFVAQQDCVADRPDASAPGLGAGDHVGSQAPPTDFALPSGSYCGVNLPMLLSAAAPANAPAALAGHSMLIQGTLADGRSFTLASALHAQLALRATGAGFELDAQRSGVLIGFDVATWLDTLAWDSAEVDASGRVLVDEGHNSELLSSFEQHVPGGVTLFRDADRDGLLDADPVALAHGSD
jgi:hypothetical protein